jgi:hypothetical protein
MTETTQQFDFLVVNGGSIIILSWQSCAGEEWVKEHIPVDAIWFGGGVVVERRYIDDILTGIVNDWLTFKII